jgi:hypothetical protein
MVPAFRDVDAQDELAFPAVVDARAADAVAGAACRERL